MATEEIGDYLKELRKRQRLSLREVARVSSVSASYLSQVEKGKRSAPSPAVLRKLAPVYAIPVRELFKAIGYLEEPEMTASEEERINWAFEAVKSDPDYNYGTRLRGSDLSTDVKRFIVEIYEGATRRKLL